MTLETIRLVVVVGTRPEAIKLMPVIETARARGDAFDVCIVRTGQHRDLVDDLMDEFGIHADFNLDVMRPGQDLAHVMSESVHGLSTLIARARPDWVLVQGDTTTTFAGALAAFYSRVPIGHVEAGLRTGDRYSPFPEEANRSMTARLADLHFAPTPQARTNLLREGIDDAAIVVTGNTGIDALLRTLARTGASAASEAMPSGRYLLVTAHRRENHGVALHRICDAVRRLLDGHPDLIACIPMHPSPTVRSTIEVALGLHPRARLLEPLGYRAFAHALAGAALVLTDSGGVQEECAALGRPVLVMREETERPEGVEAGVSIVVGTDVRRIVETGSRLLDDPAAYRRMAVRSDVYGVGDASARILDRLVEQHHTQLRRAA